MANQVKMAVREAIIAYGALGWSQRRIARVLGINRETVARHLAVSKPAIPPLGKTDPKPAIPPLGKRGRLSKCEAHAKHIKDAIDAGLTAQRVYQDLKTEEGFTGAYDSVKRYVRRVFGRAVERISRMECLPGEEAQVDFGMGAPIVEADGTRRRCWVFRIVLSHSRKAYSEAVYRQTTEAFIRALENAFRYFGGVPRTLILDNLKAAVQRADWYDPELNPKIMEFARHYGITILPIRAGTPRHNGKVENSVKYVKSNALKGRSFPSIAAENLFLANWEKNIADCRIHGTTRQQPCKRFEVEKQHLHPLPLSLFPCFQEGKRAVHRDSYVEVAKAYYRVPEEYIGNQVWARWDSHMVRVFNLRLEPVRVFARLPPGQFSEVLGAGGLSPRIEHSVEYWQDRVAKMGEQCGMWANRVVEERGAYGIRVLQGLVAMSRKRSSAKIDEACRKALAGGQMHLRQIRGLIDTCEEQAELQFLSEHPLIRKMEEYGRITAQTQEAEHDEERTR